ncbi:ABC transporter permease [Trichlorobacter ammonificans]|uniref:Transport permease protein n=1 Tax=Trichlorobacter ammonificans TaxID=2916410 RepID=A0ABM9D876_9BACT|nr:ABC transporter permease [Trichlorobacter ammonificans]CAH2031357.1 Transport permease protein [Trichlorobacter ammonificans]
MECSAGISADRPSVVIEPRRGLLQLELGSIWQYRELLCFLIWRDVLTRYKQTAIGAAWVVVQPLITMLIFTFVFSRLAKVPSDGIPYPLFAFAALLPWTYFSQALAKTSGSIVSNANLVTKIYFPRLLIPLAAALAPVVDLLFSFLVLLVLMGWYRVVPSAGLLLLPLFLILALVTALAVGLCSSALNVRYRDVGSIIPFVSQVWMYVSPVAYPVSAVPEQWRLLYSLNPMVAVIEGFRWALLGTAPPDPLPMMVSTAVILLLCFVGIIYFKNMEQSFADVI